MMDAAAEVTTFALADAEQRAVGAGHALAGQLGASEWLGPLAPVAFSPFFGLCLLSGMATYGPAWIRERNALLSDSPLLSSPWLFWTMFALAVLTSLPRFTKVSKPLGLAAENLEAYSSIIILFAVRLLGHQVSGNEAGQDVAQQPMLAAGVMTWSTSLLLSLFAAMNILVINGVKLFIEFLIWLMPFPAVDAILEAANKSLCLSLMAVYAASPHLATVINLSLLLACGLVFGWTQRRLRYYQSIVLGPVLAWWWPSWFAQRSEWLPVVAEQPLQGLPRYSRLQLRIGNNQQVELRGRGLWRSLQLELQPCRVEYQPQLVSHRLVLHHQGEVVVSLLHRRWVYGDECFENWPTKTTRGKAMVSEST